MSTVQKRTEALVGQPRVAYLSLRAQLALSGIEVPDQDTARLRMEASRIGIPPWEVRADQAELLNRAWVRRILYARRRYEEFDYDEYRRDKYPEYGRFEPPDWVTEKAEQVRTAIPGVKLTVLAYHGEDPWLKATWMGESAILCGWWGTIHLL